MGESFKIWLAGDSTVASFKDDYYYPRYGYGTKLYNYLDSKIKIVNLALSGRSSKSYLTEPNYQILIEGLKKNDILMLGFGHNDQKNDPERYTNANLDYKAPGSFANTLYENYILKAQSKGARVILCTPIVRRAQNKIWIYSDLHVKPDDPDFPNFPGGNYRRAIIDMGKTLDIPVIELTGLSKKLHENLGYEETLFFQSWLNSNPASVDNTHTNEYGADLMAYLIIEKIYTHDIHGLKKYIKNLKLPQKQKYIRQA